MNQKYKGILFIVSAAFCFSCMNACVRLSGDVPTMQKVFFRNLVALLVAVAMLKREGTGFRPTHKKNIPWLWARVLIGTGGILGNFYAVDHMLLADATMLNKLSPFFAVIASIFLLKEKLHPVQGLILAGAFAGTMFIIRPTFESVVPLNYLAALCGGLFAGVAYTIVRLLGQKGEKKTYIVFVFSAFSCLMSLPWILLDFHPMTMQQTLCLLAAGFFGAGGQFSITAAYSYAPAREISVYDYSQIVFSALLGFFLFGDRPDLLSYVGYLIICGMAVLNFWYSNHLHHKELAAQKP